MSASGTPWKFTALRQVRLSRMKRKVLIVAAIASASIPLMCLWWNLTVPGEHDSGRVPVLFLLLLLGVAVMVGVPALVIRDLLRRRWILIAMLALVNVFWCLEWITAYSITWAGDVRYNTVRWSYIYLMVVSSALTVCVYWVCGKLLDRIFS